MEHVIEFEVELERSRAETWTLVTDPTALGTWMLGAFEFEPVAGSDLIFRSESTMRRGEVVAVEVERRFGWRWTDGHETSEVSIEIDGDGERSLVSITERLLPPRRWARPSIPPMEASVA